MGNALILKHEPPINYEKELKNILAITHRDGGHYTEKHGIKKSIQDAVTKIADALVK